MGKGARNSAAALEARYIKGLTLDTNRRTAISKHIKSFSYADDSEAWNMWIWNLIYWLATIPAYFVLPKALWVALRGGMMVRSFILFHDLTHEAYFKSRSLNRIVGNITAALCITPYEDWGSNHKRHHEIFGDLSNPRFDGGNTTWFTKQWVDAWPLWKRVAFYILRDPIFVYVWVAPVEWWLLFHFRAGGLITTISHVACWSLFYAMDGWTGVWYEALSSLVGAGFGLYLFHMQHSVNKAYRVHRHEDHDIVKSGLYGSTYLHLLPIFKFFTVGIEYHHIHHISTQVPCYRLRECHESAPAGMWEGIVHVDTLEKWVTSSFHTMWDDDSCSLVTFPWYQAILSLLGFALPSEDLVVEPSDSGRFAKVTGAKKEPTRIAGGSSSAKATQRSATPKRGSGRKASPARQR